MVITLFLKGELNKTTEGNNTDVNRNKEEKVIKRNIGRNGENFHRALGNRQLETEVSWLKGSS